MNSILMMMPDAFHLGWMGATRRLFHIAEAFKSMDFEIKLVAGAMTNPSLQAEIDQSFPGQVIRLAHTGDYPFFIDHSILLRRAWRALWKLGGDNCYWPKLSWGWADRMNVKYLLKNLFTIEHTPELIWGVGAGYLEGAVAAQQIAHKLKLPWIFELQDPPRRAGLGPDNEIVKRRFTELLNDAARVIVTTDSYGTALSQKYRLDYNKICSIHLSYDGKSENSADASVKHDFFTMVYAGSLNGGRTMRPLLEAITAAFKEQPEMRQSFKFEIAGSGPGFDEIDQLSPVMGLTKNIISHGLISRDMAATLIERAVVVVIVQENKSALQVPGKVFETLKVGKTVLGMMPKICEAAKILVQSGLGYIHETNDVEGLRETLIRMWAAWRESRKITDPNELFIRKFSAEQLPCKLSNALKGVISIRDF